VRVRLFKVVALVKLSVRRVRVAISSVFPLKMAPLRSRRAAPPPLIDPDATTSISEDRSDPNS
jgi:hypothetical protein